MNHKNIKDLLNDEDVFAEFIKNCEENTVAAPENFTSSVMFKINAERTKKENKAKKVIPFISRRMRAAACFCSAAAIMAMAYFGVNERMLNFLSAAVSPETIEKLGEVLDIFSRFNISLN